MTTDLPNIVLMTVDSLRADHCGFMGYEKDTTPTLDEMAKDGVVFENAIAPGPNTPESMPVIFTGEYPVERSGEPDSALAARRERIQAHMHAHDTLPEKLQRLGYETAAFTPNPFTSRHFGFDQGFDHFEDFMDASTRGHLYQKVFRGLLEGNGTASMARILMNFWNREEVFKPWTSYYDDVLEWIGTAEEPYFLWVFLMDAHNPYIAPSEFRSQSRWKQFHANFEFWRQSHETPFSDTVHERLVTAYDDAIQFADGFLAELQEELKEGEATLVVHGDHGEAFGEHGSYGHEPYLYEENLYVPLVVADGSGTRIDAPVSLRTMPELLTGIADRTPVDALSGSRECVVSRTRQGNKMAIHCSAFDAVWDHQRLELTEPNKSTAEEVKPVRETFDKLLATLEEHETEKIRIATEALQAVEAGDV